MFRRSLIFCVLLVFLHESQSNQEEIVETWANKFGEELWELGTLVTRIPDIKTKYKVLNARVLPTNGEAILNSIVTNLNRMMQQKMDAVWCLIKAAEELSEHFDYNASSLLSYHGSKVSIVKLDGNVTLEPNEEYIVPKFIDNDIFSEAEYRDMELIEDSHFHGIPVNTNYSAVHVPTDVFDQGDNVKEHIQWSEGLDKVFVKNYMSDPTLKWQFFGSTSGFLRHYPAFKWKEPEGKEVDEFDCRTRPWFIEAATCSKDVVILMDTSGSMTGMRLTMAKLTVNSILDTFSNNDFINVIGFSNVTRNVVPCFTGDMLVQATVENIQTFKNALEDVVLDGKSNFSNAYIHAFNLLEQYRLNRSCEKTCNQAVMLVTDSVTDNLTEVFQAYNWFENRTHIPVRVFTYLIGREVTKVREIQWMACLNRGYYVHIQTLEETRSQVLKYIPVIARPLVLQGVEHPISWTHPFADISDPAISTWLEEAMENEEQKQQLQKHLANQLDYFSQRKEDDKYIKTVTQDELGETTTDYQEYRMMTAVSGPAYDRKKNKNNETKSADLLGIAGTDVYIRDIERLTLPYKIGANGYAFVITNNGYLLLHPDSRPVYRGVLKDNYNSVDLTEVELLDDDVLEPRRPSEEIKQLRQSMIDHKVGNTSNLKMKFQYDDFRRVGAETRNYYYAPLENTPFTIGLVLPHSYGNYWIKAGDEIKKTVQMGDSITDFFKGNWRVHPNWVYCDYHRSSAHGNESREERLLGFMKQMKQMHWKWYEQYPDPKEGEDEDRCNRKEIGDDEYYCDKELMQLLVFDGKSTQMSYETKKYTAKSRREQELVNNYKVMLRFLATQSGLTRWQYVSEHQDETEWGDSNNEALNEPWYRSAVLQHHIDPDAFVFSVPFDAGEQKNITVTASHAIFPKDGGNEAPGSVVGLLFPHTALSAKFEAVTSKPNCPECDFACNSDSIDCYVIDGNGYIIVSEIAGHTGRFFGEFEGAIMEAMVSKNIFRRIHMFDYQALCFEEIPVNNTASFLLTPIHHVVKLGQWLIGNLLWYLLETTIWRPVFAYDEDYPTYDTESGETSTQTPKQFVPKKDIQRNMTISEECDKQGDLYLLQHLSKEGYHSTDIVDCSRPYTVKRIPHTNLLLIVVHSLHQSCYKALSATMKEIEYGNSTGIYSSCQKIYLNELPRRRLSGCFNEHPLENEIITCGRGSRLNMSWIIVIFIIFKTTWNYLPKYTN